MVALVPEGHGLQKARVDGEQVDPEELPGLLVRLPPSVGHRCQLDGEWCLVVVIKEPAIRVF